ncbi:predicted protein [Lichtheimia corymbifera JMRC:FSU:9682]|uniref:Uncharacterized protein n=1 Tax=Lichtheimia corymbifera JMRC:FSU:9682 TaxID=1263082 RepID=A0A068RSP7_9FUNG|nr:predicted protein [Lichtheimia corymbifera JMRC:FSU:9682]
MILGNDTQHTGSFEIQIACCLIQPIPTSRASRPTRSFFSHGQTSSSVSATIPRFFAHYISAFQHLIRQCLFQRCNYSNYYKDNNTYLFPVFQQYNSNYYKDNTPLCPIFRSMKAKYSSRYGKKTMVKSTYEPCPTPEKFPSLDKHSLLSQLGVGAVVLSRGGRRPS